MKNLKDKVVFITGGARGLGYCSAQHFAAEGAKVIIGETDLDATWDGFVADIKAMDIETCIAAYQAAYDRYQAR